MIDADSYKLFINKNKQDERSIVIILKRGKNMKSIIFNTISDFYKQGGLPEPENPLIGILHSEKTPGNSRSCDDSPEVVSVTANFYTISLKNIISGEILYGRTKYDCNKGSMLFTAPNQTMIFKDVVFSSETWHLSFHEDYILGHEIRNRIKHCNFFNYNVNEALHLSAKEEKVIKSILNNIKTEYENNQDEFSKDIILMHLDTLLKYANRFYKRQFLNRKNITGETFKKFQDIIDDYFESGAFKENGLPSIDGIANKLRMSPRYLSDCLKAETGKSAMEHIHLYLIDEAKNLLLTPSLTVSEIAYQLGFEYPQYFSRLFKKRLGMTPSEYRSQNIMN